MTRNTAKLNPFLMEAVLGVRDRGGLHLIRHHVSNRTVSNYAHQCPYIGNSSTVRLYLAIELVSPTFSGACWCLDPRAFDARYDYQY